jgi:spore maturation protein CgeB
MSPIKILVTCIHYPVASGRYIADAFRRLGHEVRTIGPSTGADIWGVKVHERYIWKSDRDLNGVIDGDLMIVADSSLEYTHKGAEKVVVWGVDNHCRDYWPESKYDALFMAHSWGARMSEPNAHWLPCAYDPAWFHDDDQERVNDVVMVGVMYDNRREIVQAMERSGLHVIAGTGAVYEEYNALYNTAKIALVKSACGDLPIRFFENMAQGCCVLSDYLPDAIKLGFNPGEDFYLYNGPEEAATAARWLIDSGEWVRIAANGKKKVKSHTWDARALQLLRTMEMSQ